MAAAELQGTLRVSRRFALQKTIFASMLRFHLGQYAVTILAEVFRISCVSLGLQREPYKTQCGRSLVAPQGQRGNVVVIFLTTGDWR